MTKSVHSHVHSEHARIIIVGEAAFEWADNLKIKMFASIFLNF